MSDALFPNLRRIQQPADSKPQLLVVIHTEEEFDWGKPFDSSATGVRHMAYIHRAQDLFRQHGVRPTYVIDYPIADQQDAWGELKPYADAGEAEIGAHCHPWVSPPLDEDINRLHSYPGNLPRDLEQAKLTRLTERIAQSFGRRPTTYLAGRYGFGPHTADILAGLGYTVDISPAPPLDFRDDGGPNYSQLGTAPFWFSGQRQGPQQALLCLPGTGAYVGAASRIGSRLAPALHRQITRPGLSWARLPGILSRLKLLDRLRLSPEGYSFEDQRKLTRALLQAGQRLFVYSFHSPSVLPGCTPYVSSDAELRSFLDNCNRYLDFFTNELGGHAPTASEFHATLASDDRTPS